ncbi:tRNA uracil 4-sulfurtransferase ThiI [Geoglobus acetivorans]|uniref:Probable tRNA sulfurtransferase n=1 Tax=Geoglobus acetivorans TaxID=565033 RepID=A0ABZ3H404_GEOAI|nr:tRNA 4-thiouridine(8) synthase ThiI [Geoglobus acetivorans]
MRVYVVHYSEIALKGKNRSYFEKKLVSNLKRKLGDDSIKIRREYGRIVIDSGEERIENVLRKTPGVKYSALAEMVEPDVELIAEKAIEFAPDSGTFRVETKRSYKEFPMNSMEVNRLIGERILRAKKNLKVDLRNPENTVYIEISKDHAYVYSGRIEGVGGLPTGVSGKVVTLISGGIDSPVSAFMAMKRGAEVVAVHFFNSTIHSPSVRKKIHDLARKLSEYHRIKLYMVPFVQIQREIIAKIPADYRMVVYRRSMMRMASMIAEKENAKAIFTGDNLGQVASQTLDNMRTIYEAAQYPVLTPLIGLDKDEIIEVARKIGTYEISILPYEDCCSLLMSRHPVTKTTPEDVMRFEGFCNLQEEEAVENAEVYEYGF